MGVGVFDTASVSLVKLISDFLHGLLDLLGDLVSSLGKELERWLRELISTFDLSDVLSDAGGERVGERVGEGCLMEARQSFRDFSAHPASHVAPGTPILIVKKMTHGAMVLLSGRLSFWDYDLIAQRARPLEDL
jgi:hypothetical protein